MCRAICGVTIVVSPSGQIANITAASKIARPGDVIELMAGTYTAKEQIYKLYGTRDMPITIRAGADGGVVFDGSSLTLSGSTPILSFYQVGYLVVQGPIEIRSSSGNGMNVLNGTHMEICNLTIHETQKWALATSGVDIHIHHNEMYRCVLENEDGKSTHGWSQCVASWAIDSAANTLSSGVLWEFNTIHDTWGEGLDLIQCDGCTARDNTVYDSWSVLLYSDNVRNILIERNVLYCTSDEHNRNGNRPTILLIGTESWPTHPIPTVNLTIRNNLGIGGGNGIAYYGEENYYSEIKAYYNTFWNTTGAGVYFPENPTQGISSGNELRNNQRLAIHRRHSTNRLHRLHQHLLRHPEILLQCHRDILRTLHAGIIPKHITTGITGMLHSQ
ncbi:hypothetical protein Pelo_1953 [Pelomyxa schiedti]|nr:hypothetical protein Pelo_1953 [Pelomyxa schiedti]